MMEPENDQQRMEQRYEILAYIKACDPDGAEKLTRLIEKKEFLTKGNVYGERFTDRQFSLVFDPLLARALERARMLENLQCINLSVPELAKKLGLATNVVFDHIKELLRRDLVEIAGYKDRHALYKRK